jgi:hypothetical protein
MQVRGRERWVCRGIVFDWVLENCGIEECVSGGCHAE